MKLENRNSLVIKIFFILGFLNITTSFSQYGLIDTIAIQYPDLSVTFDIDINQDGDTDLVALYSNAFVYFENHGNGTFGGAKNITNSVGIITSVAPVDMDNDLDVDFVVFVPSVSDLYWIENDGFGNFVVAHLIDATISNVVTIETGDLDGNGLEDVFIVKSSGSELMWYKNLGSFAFSGEQMINGSALANDIEIVDIDGDLDLDLVYVVANEDQLAWAENLGGGVLSAEQTIFNTNAPHRLLIYDVDNDSDLDIITGPTYGGGSNQFFTLNINQGGGMFNSSLLYGSTIQTQSMDLLDYNGDGLLDLIIAESYYDFLLIFLNNGNGTFQNTPIYHYDAIGNVSHFVNVADFNNDGFSDIIYMEMNSFYLDFGYGGGVFQFENVINNSVVGLSNLLFADLDGDSDEDLILVEQTARELSWYENAGNDKFESKKCLDHGTAVFDSWTDDIDSDGDIDIVGSFNGSIKIFENLGGGSFAAGLNILSGIAGVDIEMADLNSDGLKDIVISEGGLVKVSIASAPLSYNTPITILSSLSNVKSVSINDFNNDGNKDVLISSFNSDIIGWIENFGGGAFGSFMPIATIDGVVYVCTEDLNNDGDMDVLFSSSTNAGLGWIENLGGGSFGPPNILSLNYFSVWEIGAIDLDNDLDKDIYCAAGSDVIWFENTGGGTFYPIPNEVPLLNNSDIAISDTDQDGDLDFAVYQTISGEDLVVHVQSKIFSDTQISGKFYVDLDTNGVFDNLDFGIADLGAISNPQSDVCFSLSSGIYKMNLSDTLGSYEILPQTPDFWYISSDSLSYTVLVDSLFSSMDSLDFGFAPDTLIDFLEADLVGGFPRCNQLVSYWIKIKNFGTTVPTGIIQIKLDDSITFVNSLFPPDSVSGQSIYWSYDSLSYFGENIFQITVQMPDFNSINDTLKSFVYAYVDSLSMNNYFVDSLQQVLVCAYDPNDKTSPQGIDTPGYVPISTEYLEYVIRFQNTGNDTALNVVIKDYLDYNLNWSTLTPIAYSHPVSIDIDQFGMATFAFNNIYLPDSNTNELGSHGFIKFRIDVHSGMISGTQIPNFANIYFDFNPPITTNTTTHTFYDCNSVLNELIIYPVSCQNETLYATVQNAPSDVGVTWTIAGDVETGHQLNYFLDTSGTIDLLVQIEGLNGLCVADTTVTFLIISEILIDDSYNEICDGDSILIFGEYRNQSGIYSDTLISMSSGCDSILLSELVVFDCLGAHEINKLGVTIFPNPFQEYCTINFDEYIRESDVITIYDMQGNRVYQSAGNKGDSVTIFSSELNQGIFLLTITEENGATIFVARIIVL